MRFLRSIHVAVVVLLLTIAVSFYVDGRNDQIHRQHLEVSTRLERMLRLNHQLTDMLTIAVLEQNPLRASTYNTVNNELNQTILEVSQLTRSLALSQEIVALNADQSELRQLEQRAIAWMQADAWAPARALLFDDDYLMARKIYEIDTETAVGALSQELSEVARQFERWRHIMLVLRLGALGLLLWVGGAYSRRLQQELDEQVRLRGEITQANQGLEAKVAKRTAELQAANQQLEVLSNTDGLTGLSNRHRFDQVWAQEWQRAVRQGLPLAVVMIDVDHFKLYNDQFGHPAGDECLRRVAAVLAHSVRRAGELAARYSGEEFVVVLPGLDANGALQEAERIRTEVSALGIPHTGSSAGAVVTVSLGVASRVPQREEGLYLLLQEADDALYQAKHGGRNRVGLASGISSPPPSSAR
ncbi:GGDEF domain-containing protein [Macromonas bipunctata]|uniref:GGDEF domain-containing protein n=1 Tax=Macromonas bipunctata TaxID=183670 RepID=UPI000C34E5C2|nr:diguanylate cyclase [Macromonas bipunctata]